MEVVKVPATVEVEVAQIGDSVTAGGVDVTVEVDVTVGGVGISSTLVVVVIVVVGDEVVVLVTVAVYLMYLLQIEDAIFATGLFKRILEKHWSTPR